MVLIVLGQLGSGIFILLWGALVVSVLCDCVLRPKLVGGKGQAPSLVTFIALFGGVEVFGLIGLIVVPVSGSVALPLPRTYDHAEQAASARRAARTREPANQ